MTLPRLVFRFWSNSGIRFA